MKAILNSLIIISLVILSSCSGNISNKSKSPLSELEITKGKHYGYYDISSKNLNYLIKKHNVQGEELEIIAEILPEHADSFGIKIYKGEKIVLLFDVLNEQLTVTSKKDVKTAPLHLQDDKVFIHLLIGNGMLEVLNNNETVAITCPCTTRADKNSISMFDVNRKATIEHFDIWEITSAPKED